MHLKRTLSVLAIAAVATMAKDYSGAELYTNDTWMYGKFEARMQMAAGSGTVSSMFLYHNDSYLGGNEPWVEVDIEILGKNPNSFQSNIITGYGPDDKTGAPNRKITSEKHHPIEPASNQSFHTYGMEWTPNYVAWTLDGKVVRKTVKGQESGCKAEADQQQQSYCNQVEDLGKKRQDLRFNLWSHEDAGWVGTWNDDILPVYQFINWVKTYKYTPGEGPNGSDFTLDWKDDFETFNQSRWSVGDWTFDGNRVDISPNNVYAKNGMVIIALTKKGQENFSGQVPQDPEGDAEFNNDQQQQSSSSEQFNQLSSSSQESNQFESSSSSADPTGILPTRVKLQNKEVRGTVNAKGARVNPNNKANYQVDFNF